MTGRGRVAQFEGCYHDAYDWMEVSLDSTPVNWSDENGDPASVRLGLGMPASVLAETVVLPYDAPQRCADVVRREGRSLAAIVVDPLASQAVPCRCRERRWLFYAIACQRGGILLIADEIINFRFSFDGTSRSFGLEPDLITTARLLAVCLHIGAASGSFDQMSVYSHPEGKPKVPLGGTFSGNLLIMAAGLASLTHYSQSAIGRLNGLSDQLRNKLKGGFSVAVSEPPLRAWGCCSGSIWGRSYHRLPDGVRQSGDGSAHSTDTKRDARSWHLAHAELLRRIVDPMTKTEISLISENTVAVLARDLAEHESGAVA
ncbi:aminotransferase class III-fold pyridoxal phosphate-dependent enzyme [Bradyrhizobium canariense]|uniref:aminotransferase class III-fold pyridoxal phosphate-dependent enzyme n=1 Tax=Bradyrhizobium canariense TaxID=255045 RepID=UPI001F0AB69F|nr:aminotransferase class III-fold pyridoxal phosphate-dependent enzyme [Bradyrhizobium canariense]